MLKLNKNKLTAKFRCRLISQRSKKIKLNRILAQKVRTDC